MIFAATPIPGAHVIALEQRADERGFFARTWCRDEFARAGIPVEMVQASLSHNQCAGTLRGMHFAWPPANEAKLVRCERGAVHDVILDLRPDSPAYQQHFAIVLDDKQCNAVYIPSGVAHGFQTLADDCDVLYMMTERYLPEFGDGVRFDDPAFGISWPRPIGAIAARDRAFPDFDPAAHAARFQRASAGG